MDPERVKTRQQSRAASRNEGEGGGRERWQRRWRGERADAAAPTHSGQRRGRRSRAMRTARRQGARQAMFKVQLALEVLQQSAGMGVVGKWESMVRKIMARSAAVPGWARRWVQAERVLGWMQEELRYNCELQNAECLHSSMWVVQKSLMAELRGARVRVHECRHNAQEIVGRQQGLVQRAAKEMAAEAQMGEARYLLAAGAGQGVGAKAGVADSIDYEVAALAKRRESALQRLLVLEADCRARETNRAARAEADAATELGKRQMRVREEEEEQSARVAKWLEEAEGLKAMVRKAERRADKQERRCVQLVRGLGWVEQKLAELMAEREGVWRELRQSKTQLKKAEARVQYERSQAQHIWQTARQCVADEVRERVLEAARQWQEQEQQWLQSKLQQISQWAMADVRVVVAEMTGAMKSAMREVMESGSGEWWQHMTSKGVSERMDRFSEVAEAAAVRGGNSPVGSSGVQQRKVKQRKQRKQRKHSWAVRKQKRIRSRGKEGEHQQDAVPKGRRAEMTTGSKDSIHNSTVSLQAMIKFRKSNREPD
jgi:hypothetical protein